ncbi:MAG: hypothetical protein VW715_07060 [Rhodospirillales bacterium]|jgi:hypothetical protein
MDDFQIQRLLAEISTLKEELRLANALALIKVQENYSMTSNDAKLEIDRALKNIKENYGP